MRRKRETDNEIRNVLHALLSDIEAMYEGEEISADRGQPEEFFSPFSVSKLGDAGVSVSWPNLAISMRNAKSVLRNGESDNLSSSPPSIPR